MPVNWPCALISYASSHLGPSQAAPSFECVVLSDPVGERLRCRRQLRLLVCQQPQAAERCINALSLLVGRHTALLYSCHSMLQPQPRRTFFQRAALWARERAPCCAGLTKGGAATLITTTGSVLGAVVAILAAAETWPGIKPEDKQKMIVIGSIVAAVLSVFSSVTGYTTPAPAHE